MPYKFDIVSRMTRFDTIHADRISIGRVTSLTSIEVMHWERCITRYFVQTLSIGNRFLDSILIVEYLERKNLYEKNITENWTSVYLNDYSQIFVAVEIIRSIEIFCKTDEVNISPFFK